MQAALQQGGLHAAWGVARSGFVIAGLAMYGLGALLWLLVLARIDVSAAYPFVGLGFVMTMMLGWLLLGESLQPTRVAGTLLIALGVVLVARTT